MCWFPVTITSIIQPTHKYPLKILWLWLFCLVLIFKWGEWEVVPLVIIQEATWSLVQSSPTLATLSYFLCWLLCPLSAHSLTEFTEVSGEEWCWIGIGPSPQKKNTHTDFCFQFQSVLREGSPETPCINLPWACSCHCHWHRHCSTSLCNLRAQGSCVAPLCASQGLSTHLCYNIYPHG